MGENEQGGMLRTVVVVGLVALIAMVITIGVVGMKASMNKNTNIAVGSVMTTQKPVLQKYDTLYANYDPNNTGWSHGPRYRIPYIGEIPNDSWRDIYLDIEPKGSGETNLMIDINEYTDKENPSGNNDLASRLLITVQEDGNSKMTYIAGGSYNVGGVNLKDGKTYHIHMKIFNETGATIFDAVNDGSRTALIFNKVGSTDPVEVLIKNVTAATYDDKYNK